MGKILLLVLLSTALFLANESFAKSKKTTMSNIQEPLDNDKDK